MLFVINIDNQVKAWLSFLKITKERGGIMPHKTQRKYLRFSFTYMLVTLIGIWLYRSRGERIKEIPLLDD
jgi:hypothetical protein